MSHPRPGQIGHRDVAVAAAAPLRHVREAFDRSVAVALGVDAYQRGIPRLKTAVADAEAIAAVLQSRRRELGIPL